MKLIAAVLGALVAAVALTATSLASEGDDGRSADRLFGGGRFQFDFDQGPGELVLPRDISIEATGDGRSGSGTRYYGNPSRATRAPAHDLDCLRVEGNRAVVGHVQVGTVPPDTVQFFEDNGPIGPDPADRISPIFLMTAEEVTQYMPRGFPRVCPSTTPPADWGNVWVDLDYGDIAVVEGTEDEDEDDD